jgi:hypothetical protein
VEDGGTYKYGRTASDIQGGLQTLIHKSDQLKADVKVLLTPHSTCGRAANAAPLFTCRWRAARSGRHTHSAGVRGGGVCVRVVTSLLAHLAHLARRTGGVGGLSRRARRACSNTRR